MSDPVLCINCKMAVHPEALVCPHCRHSPTKVYVSGWTTLWTWVKRAALFYIALVLLAGGLAIFLTYQTLKSDKVAADSRKADADKRVAEEKRQADERSKDFMKKHPELFKK